MSMRTMAGFPIPPTEPQAGTGMCQPPLVARDLMNRLTPGEQRQALHIMILYAPEVFEKALRDISQMRAYAAGHRVG